MLQLELVLMLRSGLSQFPQQPAGTACLVRRGLLCATPRSLDGMYCLNGALAWLSAVAGMSGAAAAANSHRHLIPPWLLAAGSGLSYQGQPLVATAPFAPLLLANTSTTPPGPTDDNLSFPPAGM